MAASPLVLMLWAWLGAATMMAALWAIQVRTRDAGIVDVGWAAGLGGVGLFLAGFGGGDPARRTLLAVLCGAWAFRLAGYLLLNRVIGKPEDGRYQALRQKWGGRANSYFFLFFQAQALLDVLLGLPFLAVAFNGKRGLDGWDWAGAALWLVAVAGEMVADAQLAIFRADPANRGKVCRAGIWHTSRHPNYFFEWLHWFVYPLLALGSPYFWLTAIGPALMTFFLFKVTGIPATEAQALKSRGEDYRRYQQTTSAFVPWLPKRKGE